MSKDFFDKIDATLGEQKSAKKSKEKSSDESRAFVAATIPRLVKIAEEYRDACKARGMNVDVKSHEYAVTFQLRYGSGQERTLVGSPDHGHGNKLSFEQHFPNDDGKRYKTMPMNWYDEKNWSDDVYRRLVEKTIEDFVFYAERFGGV